MQSPYAQTAQSIHYDASAQADFLRDVIAGLQATPKRLPSKYFYDDEGSQIFQKIMALPEYYLTRAEIEILETHRERIATHIGHRSLLLVELGAGDGTKTKLLLECLLHRHLDLVYAPIDISAHAIQTLSQMFMRRFPSLTVRSIIDDYFHGLARLEREPHRVVMALFLGSNIGNFTQAESLAFLSCLRKALRYGDFALIGFDLKKDIQTLLHAYSDSAGVTRDFNLNLLRRINRELGATFRPFKVPALCNL
ncbi:MAG: L-histidine N(alpha)-methyltransferase [Chloroherpetonaceae bacterium]|nr:L-histidine N(alpha)-methyltransferase [Chloroherpetonaceae bacterium]